MKKTILSLAILAMSTAGITASAQSKTTTVCPVSAEQCQPAAECLQHCSKYCFDRYKGLDLTDSQKEQLRKLDEERANARKTRIKDARENKQRNDSTRFEQRRTDRKNYLEKVKSIVGPEKYVIFLENFFVDTPVKNLKKSSFDKKKHNYDKKFKVDRNYRNKKGLKDDKKDRR